MQSNDERARALRERFHEFVGSERGPLAGAGVPPSFWGARLEDFDDGTGEFVSAQIEDGYRSFFIHGPAGRGKSRLAAAILATIGPEYIFYEQTHSLRNVFVHMRWIHWLEFAQQCRDAAARGVLSELIAATEKNAMLVIDDLGAERHSDFVHDNLVLLLSKREQMQRPLIVTSNIDLVRFDAFDERIGSRLRRCVEVLLKGDDRRAER